MERITDPQRTKILLPSLIPLLEFNKAAAYNTRLFEKDPYLADFLVALQKHPHVNHFSVLWMGEKPLAFHYGHGDGKWTTLGLTGYDPTEYKNSPGILLLIELAQLLVKEGVDTFDITPGVDPYKDRFANRYEDVHTFHLHFTYTSFLRQKIVDQVRGAAKKILEKWGVTKGKLKHYIIDLKAWKTRLTSLSLYRILSLCFYQRKIIHIYRSTELSNVSFKSIPDDGEQTVREQAFQDLLLYRDHTPFLSTRDALISSNRKFAKADRLFTLTGNDELIHYGWLRKGNIPVQLPGGEFHIEDEADTQIASGFYTSSHSKGVSSWEKIVKAMVKHCQLIDAKRLYLCLNHRHKASESLIDNLGLELQASWKHYRLFSLLTWTQKIKKYK